MSNIFRQYDIRGVVNQDLDDQMMKNISRAFASYAQKHDYTRVIIGYDNRSSSPRFHTIITNTLLENGMSVIDLGMIITPIFYFAARHLDIKAGIMITASHNPPNYNGCKLLLGDSTIYGEQIQEIGKIIESGRYSTKTNQGQYQKYDISPDYAAMIKNKIKLGPHPLKIVVDCANGTASLFAPSILRSLGCEVIELYCESDPNYPHHHPDPVNPDNMVDLITRVKETGADIGIGFDGDGDRLGVVDVHGNMIWGDLLMILFWREILPHYPGAKAIVEVKCSQSLIDEIKRLGGKPIIYKTGHSLIKAKMKEINAVFTGEMSGHMFFADDYYGFDDAIYAAARLLVILSNTDQSISELLSDIPRYYSTPEIRVKSTDEDKFRIVDQVLKHFRQQYDVIDIDGARVIFPDGWGLVRASNTGPELIIRCEGRTPAALENIKNEVFNFLDKIGLPVDNPRQPQLSGYK
ncbi:phosphomannomutase/phosphoglucomutase [Syntrophomonas erecta]